MKVIIVEDEMPARKRIENLLLQVEQVEIIQECSTGKQAISAINENKPDLIFLDINLPDLNGFQVLQEVSITPKPLVIFVTAYDHYALEAFDHEAFDFLLKPFKEERFFKTLYRVMALTKKENELRFDKRLNEIHEFIKRREANNYMLKLPVKEGNKTTLVEIDKINYVLGSGSYSEVYTQAKKHLLRESLNNLSRILNSEIFLRVHRSAIINLNYVQEIVHSNYSEIDVRMKDNKLIKISKSQKKIFLSKMGL